MRDTNYPLLPKDLSVTAQVSNSIEVVDGAHHRFEALFEKLRGCLNGDPATPSAHYTSGLQEEFNQLHQLIKPFITSSQANQPKQFTTTIPQVIEQLAQTLLILKKFHSDQQPDPSNDGEKTQTSAPSTSQIPRLPAFFTHKLTSLGILGDHSAAPIAQSKK